MVMDLEKLRDEALQASAKQLRTICEKQDRGAKLTRTEQHVLLHFTRLMCEQVASDREASLKALERLDPAKWTDEHLRTVLKAAGREDLARGIGRASH